MLDEMYHAFLSRLPHVPRIDLIPPVHGCLVFGGEKKAFLNNPLYFRGVAAYRTARYRSSLRVVRIEKGKQKFKLLNRERKRSARSLSLGVLNFTEGRNRRFGEKSESSVLAKRNLRCQRIVCSGFTRKILCVRCKICKNTKIYAFDTSNCPDLFPISRIYRVR